MSRDIERALTQFFGGRVCLDFANTLDWRTSSAPQELIADYTAFLRWSALRRTIPISTVEKLSLMARAKTDKASAVMTEVFTLRSEIWSISDALRDGREVGLGVVNTLISEAPHPPQLVLSDGAYLHDLPGRDLREPLWPVVWSLTSLLTSADAARIGCCHAEGCGWFYVDESPNRTRLWCSSAVCGNRERARRAYAKRRSE